MYYRLSTCFNYLAVDADYYCSEVFCPSCPYAGHCDTYCGFCEGLELVRDCNGNLAPSSWIGDSFCDNANYLYDSEYVNFNCPDFGCDNNDCAEADANNLRAECATAAPSPTTPSPMGASIPISNVQTQYDRSGDVLLYDYDCFRSPLEKTAVDVRGWVTLVTESGFYVQDSSDLWSGVFVWTTSQSSLLSLLSLGNEVQVSGFVDERLGETQIEVADEDVRVVDISLEPIEPLMASTLDLGFFARRQSGSSGCPATGEPLEGVLVTLQHVSFLGAANEDRRLEIVDLAGNKGVVDPAGFDVAAYLESMIFGTSCSAPCDLTGVSLESVTGVVNYVYRCGPGAESYYACIARNRDLTFSFAVAPRKVADLMGVSWSNQHALYVPTGSPTVDTFDDDIAAGAIEIKYISQIQSQFIADAPSEYECAPSVYVSQKVCVEGVATVADSFGFYMQDRPIQFSGIYVARLPHDVDSAGRRLLDGAYTVSPNVVAGDRVRVVGIVVEALGLTTIEALSVEVISTGEVVSPLAIYESLRRYQSVADEGCDIVAEQFESMLVTIDTATVGPLFSEDGVQRCADCFSGIPIKFGEGYEGLMDDYFYRDLKLDLVARMDDSKEANFRSVTGVVRYAYECEHEANPIYCAEGRGNFYFAHVISPRKPSDLQKFSSKSNRRNGPPRSKFTSIIIVLLFAFLIGILTAAIYTRYRYQRGRYDSTIQRCEPEFEMPMAHASEICDALCSPADLAACRGSVRRLPPANSASFVYGNVRQATVLPRPQPEQGAPARLGRDSSAVTGDSQQSRAESDAALIVSPNSQPASSEPATRTRTHQPGDESTGRHDRTQISSQPLENTRNDDTSKRAPHS